MYIIHSVLLTKSVISTKKGESVMNFKKGLAIALATATLMTSSAIGISAATLKETVEVNAENNTDATYFDYASSHIENEVVTEPVKVDINNILKDEPLSFEVTIQKDGMYNFGVSYKAADTQMPEFELSMQIDGAYPFESAKNFVLPRMWKNEDGIVEDGFGNQYAPSQIQYDKYYLNFIADNKTENNFNEVIICLNAVFLQVWRQVW